MPDNKSLGLSREDRESAMEEIARLRSQTAFMSELLSRDSLNADEAATHMGLIRQVHDSLARLLKTDALSKALDDAHAACRQANGRVRELEQMLGKDTTAASATARLALLESWFCTWYQLYGFHYMSVEWFRGGLSFSSSDEADHRDDSPESIMFGDRELAVKIWPLVPYGMANYDLKKDTFHDSILDTQANHDLLKNAIETAFPGARVQGFESHSDAGDMLLRVKGFVPWESIEAWHDGMLEALENLPEPHNHGRLYVEKADLMSRLASRTYTSHAGADALSEDRTRLAWLKVVTKLWDDATALRANCLDKDGRLTGDAVIRYALAPGDERELKLEKGMAWSSISGWVRDNFGVDPETDLAGTEDKKSKGGTP